MLDKLEKKIHFFALKLSMLLKLSETMEHVRKKSKSFLAGEYSFFKQKFIMIWVAQI